MLDALTAATLAATPAIVPVTYDLPPAPPEVQTVADPAPETPDPELYRIGKTVWTTDKAAYDRKRRADLRRVLYHTMNAADLVTTVICLEARDNCREGNPIYGQSTELVIGGKILSAVLFEKFRRKDGKGEVAEWIAIGLLTAAVGNNLTVVF